MTQQVAISVGIPVFGAVAATQAGQLEGIRLALGVAASATLATAALVAFGLRQPQAGAVAGAATTVPA